MEDKRIEIVLDLSKQKKEVLDEHPIKQDIVTNVTVEFWCELMKEDNPSTSFHKMLHQSDAKLRDYLSQTSYGKSRRTVV